MDSSTSGVNKAKAAAWIKIASKGSGSKTEDSQETLMSFQGMGSLIYFNSYYKWPQLEII